MRFKKLNHVKKISNMTIKNGNIKKIDSLKSTNECKDAEYRQLFEKNPFLRKLK